MDRLAKIGGASSLSPLAFFITLAGLFALWIFLIRRFWPPRNP
jgi:hypothetical protein